MLWKNILSKILYWLNKYHEDFENSTKYWICDNGYVDSDVKVTNHCHITEKCWGSTHRDCNIKDKLSHTVSIVLQNLKNYDSLLIMQKHMSFKINNKLIFVDIIQFLIIH